METSHDEINETVEKYPSHTRLFPSWVIFLAQFVSVIFHPLFMLVYAFLLLAWANPFQFGKYSFSLVFEEVVYMKVLMYVIMFTAVIPVIGVFLMRFLGLVKSITLEDKQERIGPFILTGMFYIVIFMSLNEATAVPRLFKSFTLGATIALFMAFFINLFSKISLHAVGMGGLVAICIMNVVIAHSNANNEFVLILAFLMAGVVGTARRILTDHEPPDIYGGFFIGFLSQFVALSFIV